MTWQNAILVHFPGWTLPCLNVLAFAFRSWWSLYIMEGFPGSSDGKEPACNAGDAGSIPGSGRSPEEGMATHSSIPAWRIPWAEDLAGFSPWGHRVGHDWATKHGTYIMESHFRAGGRRGPEPRGSAAIYSRSPASGGTTPHEDRRAGTGHGRVLWPPADAATRWRQSAPRPRPRRILPARRIRAPAGRAGRFLSRARRPRPGGDPERAASGPLPPPDAIRPASSSASGITGPRAAQESADVGRRQEEVLVKIPLDTSFADSCFSRGQLGCLDPRGVEMEFPLWSSWRLQIVFRCAHLLLLFHGDTPHCPKDQLTDT